MTPGRLPRQSEFTPVPSHGSTFVYMIPPQNVMPERVTPAWVHPGCCTGARISLRYEILQQYHVNAKRPHISACIIWPQNRQKWGRGSDRPAAHTQQKLTQDSPPHPPGSKCTVQVLTRFMPLLFATQKLRTSMVVIASKKSNNNQFHPSIAIIVFKMKSSSFSRV